MAQYTNTGRQMTVVQLHVDDSGETHYSESLYEMTEAGLAAAPETPSGARAFYLDLPAENLSVPEQQFMLVISGSILSKCSDNDIFNLYPDKIVPVKTYSREAYKQTHKSKDAVAFIVRF